MTSPRKHLTVAVQDSSPRHSHAGRPTPASTSAGGTKSRRLNPTRRFALLTIEAARELGLFDRRGDLCDHELTPDVLEAASFAVVSDKNGQDDALETRAPAVAVRHGHRDCIAAQLNNGHDMGIGDLTYWVETDDLIDDVALVATAAA